MKYAIIALGLLPAVATIMVSLPANGADKPVQNVSADAELLALYARAQQFVEAQDYLRAHVALQRIEELCRFGGLRFRDAATRSLRQEDLRRLSDRVLSHIDIHAVEYHDGYVLYRSPNTTKPWTELLALLQQWPQNKYGLLAMRIFLENPSVEDVIQLTNQRSCQALNLANASGSRCIQIVDGQPAVVRRMGSSLCRFRIGSLRHASPQIEAEIPVRTVTALGDIVLLRPDEGAMGRLELFLDTHQANKTKSVNRLQNHFLVGPITAGGQFGMPVSLPDNDWYNAGLFAPGKIWIVWRAHQRTRWQVDISAGETTQVTCSVEPSGTLATKITSQTSASESAVNHQGSLPLRDGRSPADDATLQERK